MASLREFSSSTVKDYWALLKPRVMSLVFFTAFCGFFLAPGFLHPIEAIVSMMCIAAGAGGAGVLNMWYERNADAQMERTKERPLPRGVMHSSDALAFGIILSCFSVGVLGLAANFWAALLLAFIIFFYAGVYTVWLQPRTSQNIVSGGIAGALPPVLGWILSSQEFSWLPVLLFLIIFFWTPTHFWALALCKQGEYAQVHIPMLPSTAGIKKTKAQMFFYAVLTVACSLLPFFMGFLGPFYLWSAFGLGSVLIFMSYNVWRQSTVHPMRLFGYSILYLFLLFLLMMVDRV